MVPTAFFFDFDGTLVDSIDIKAKAFANMFEPFGSDIVDRVIEYHSQNSGVSRVDKFKYYYKKLLRKPLSETELTCLCNKFSNLVVDKVSNASEIPGAESFLLEYHQITSCFVISAAPEEELKLIIEKRGWTGFFKQICGTPAHKNVNLRLLIEKFGFESSKCIFFGDAESDYQAAKAYDVPFFGILRNENQFPKTLFPQSYWYSNFNEITPEILDFNHRV